MAVAHRPPGDLLRDVMKNLRGGPTREAINDWSRHRRAALLGRYPGLNVRLSIRLVLS